MEDETLGHELRRKNLLIFSKIRTGIIEDRQFNVFQ